jgi:hypothetical protein
MSRMAPKKWKNEKKVKKVREETPKMKRLRELR